MTYETVIGLEIHIQLATESKAFCADPARFGSEPNTQVSPISLAHPGTLPRLNERAIEYAIRLGLALGCSISPVTNFDRKNYFYADLPKGFQTTQDRAPICVGGTLNGMRIHHIHLEEDAGKSTHDQRPAHSLIDLNRAGVPLLELVTEPDLRSAEDVAYFMQEIRRLVRWLGISDGNMEEGSLRCDVNVSIRPDSSHPYGQRCEIKNLNSMRFARKAIEYEVNRQIERIAAGESIQQETRGYDAQHNRTYSLRNKENAHDYRYFPEPDLPPVRQSYDQVAAIREKLPELPNALTERLQSHFGLSAYDAAQITQDKPVADYFLSLAASPTPSQTTYKPLANLLINKLLPWHLEANIPLEEAPVPAAHWRDFVSLIESNAISNSLAYQQLFPLVVANPGSTPTELAQAHSLLQKQDDDSLKTIVEAVLARFPDKVKEYKNGKKGLLGMFMGEVMKAAKGKADPQAATKMLEEILKQHT
jgi:aspartyl-tRNA(Asn)/glutamyl-tRNA(Gln) amidotransferase subunit B